MAKTKRPKPQAKVPISQVIEAFKLIPALADTDIAAALPSHISLSGDSLAELRDQLNEALRAYVVDRVTEIVIRGISPSARLKRLVAVEKVIDNVLRLIWLEGDLIADFTQLDLRRAAHRITGSPGTSFEHDTNLERVKESVELLIRMTRAALERERKLEEKRKKLAAEGKMKARESKARHSGDQAMQLLFENLIKIWINAFHEKPTSARFGKFVKAVLIDFAGKLPVAIKNLDSGLCARLRLSPNAVRSRSRKELALRSGQIKCKSSLI